MSDFRQQLREALQATTIHSPTSYSWFGQPSSRLPAQLTARLTTRDARNYLLFDLSSRLYSHFYLHGAATPSRREGEHALHTGLTPFVAELSAANLGNGCWEDGWKVHAVDDGGVAVARKELVLWARPHDCMFTEEMPVTSGAGVRLRFPKEFLGMSPGFYMVLGDKPLNQDNGQALLRIYWNLSAEGAAPFVRIATTLLNQAGVPFRLKVLNDPVLFTRCDAAVIYLLRTDYHRSSAVFSIVQAEIGRHLKPLTPALTKPLAPGVGLAEDPGSGESFGQNRCQIAADAAIRAYEQRKKSLEERLTVATDRFAENGISIATPFLNAGSTDDYDSWSSPPLAAGLKPATMPAGKSRDSGTYLRTADELGWRLMRDAVWSGDQCNWLGAQPLPESHDGGGFAPIWAALGPDLYSGTSGIALFLAELCAASGASEARRTAFGAIRQAVGHYELIAAANCLGFYSGRLGIAFAAARIGAILCEENLLKQAAQLVQQCCREYPEERECDLLSGDAGAIVALLILRELLEDASLLELARRLGDRLLENASQSHGSSWKSYRYKYRHNLTGLSHGVAGVGYALLELYIATGDVKYRAGTEEAFQYERFWFNAEKGNWPDFREHGIRSRRSFRPFGFATFWCHGAPGIGIARLRAYELLNDETCKCEATVATRTTRAMLETALQVGNVNFSLCHGLAGNAEMLLEAHRVLGQECVHKSHIAFDVAQAGIETSKRRAGAWACGVDQGETPSLLLGLAGIGYFYLRLHNSAIPSILAPRPEDFRRDSTSSLFSAPASLQRDRSAAAKRQLETAD